MLAIGLDIGGTKTYIALGRDEKILNIREYRTPNNLEALEGILKDVISGYLVAGEKATGIGIGIAGGIKEDGTCWIPNLPYLTGVKFGQRVEEMFNLPVAIDNDAHAALIGEQWIGAAEGKRDAILVSIGTGIGGAFLVDGVVLRGAHRTAGSIGWLTIKTDPVTEEVSFYESLASGNSLNKFAKRYTSYNDSYELMEAFHKGDVKAAQVFGMWASYLGYGIASLVSLMDPEIVIITGGMCREYEAFVPVIREKIAKYSSPLTRQTPVCTAKLADKSVVFGAFKMVYDNFK